MVSTLRTWQVRALSGCRRPGHGTYPQRRPAS